MQNFKSNKNQDNYQASLSLVALKNKAIKKYLAIGSVFKSLVAEIGNNHKHYTDAAKFNFFNGIKSTNNQTNLVAYDLPSEVKKMLIDIYVNSSWTSMGEAYKALGLNEKEGNRNSPLESKYVYEYYKKYKTLEYSRSNKISKADLLKPLAKADLANYNKIIG
jgi:hypothetical protein